MFDSIQELPDTVLGNATTTDTLSGPVAELLDDHEQPRYVLAGDSVEYTTAERTTTVEPDDGHHTYLIATDDRVLVVLGEQPADSAVAFELRSVSRAEVDSGLLNTTLVVEQGAESIRLSPTHGDPEAVADFISGMAEAYADVDDAISAAEEMTEELESTVREGGSIGYLRLQLNSELSDARSSATQEHVRTDRLLERVETVETELNRRYVDAWVDHLSDTIEQAEAALDGDDYRAFCESYVTAVEALSSLRDVLTNLDDPPGDVTDVVDEKANAVDQLAETYVESTRSAYERATAADDPAETAESWLETYRRVMAAYEADWESTTDSTELPLSEIESIADATVDAVERHADTLQTAGERALDDDATTARSHFQEATARIRRAQEIVETGPADARSPYDQRLEELEAKVNVTEWEWGGD